MDVSWRRRMADAAVVGQGVTAEVLSVDLEEGRVRLSMAATENPELWAFLKRLRAGRRLAGTVAADGIEGLVHLSELSAGPVKGPEDVVRVGEEITVVVTVIDRERRRLSLSPRAAT
ncbi:S1 RNA-binding domain-containing protein [Streptomyces sp. ARC32]